MTLAGMIVGMIMCRFLHPHISLESLGQPYVGTLNPKTPKPKP